MEDAGELVIVPAAGTGTRHFPHTPCQAEILVWIAGKPIIGHIIDRVIDLEPENIVLVMVCV